MEYIQGASLASLLREGFTGFDAARVRSLLSQLLSIVGVVHKAGFLHHDISPANIILRDNHRVMLIDFGSSRETVGGHTTPYTRVFALGVAPLEQMLGLPQGPFSDIFAIGAVCYLAIGGKMVDALTRQSAISAGQPDPMPSAARIGAGRYPRPLLDVIDSALAVYSDQRPKSVESMIATLGLNAPGGEPATHSPRLTLRVIMGTVFLALVGAAGFAAWNAVAPALLGGQDTTRQIIEPRETRQQEDARAAAEKQETTLHAAEQDVARQAAEQQEAARQAAEQETARRAAEQQQREADERGLQAALTTLGYFHGSNDGNRESDMRTAILLWQSFEAAEQTGTVTTDQRERILRDAEREASLLKVPGKSPQGASADTVKGPQQRFARGAAFESGNGQPKDAAEAAWWYALSAGSGWAAAYTNLGRLWFCGSGVVAPDKDAARLLWLTAAALNDGTAMFNLGLFAENGYGGSPDPGQAKLWYQRGAERGHNESAAAAQRLGG